MTTLIGAVVLVWLFFAIPFAVILGAIGLWVGGMAGAIVGAAIGLLAQGAVS